MGAVISCISCFRDDSSSSSRSFLSETSMADSIPPPNPTPNLLAPIQEETPSEAGPDIPLREMAPPARPKTPHLRPHVPSDASSIISLIEQLE